jgi:hypothetical protein
MHSNKFYFNLFDLVLKFNQINFQFQLNNKYNVSYFK